MMLSQASFARSQALLGVIEILYLIDPNFHCERGTHVHGKQLLVGIDDAVLKIYVIGEDDEMIIREARNEIIREAFPSVSAIWSRRASPASRPKWILYDLKWQRLK